MTNTFDKSIIVYLQAYITIEKQGQGQILVILINKFGST